VSRATKLTQVGAFGPAVQRGKSRRNSVRTGDVSAKQRRGRHHEYMHYLSCLAVEAETPQEAFRKVEEFLEGYVDMAYDWYVIGGRWSGVCGGEDYVCAGENRSVFDDVVERSVKARDGHFNHIRQSLVGPDPRVPVRDSMISQPEDGSAEHQAWVERVWEGYTENSRMLNRLLGESTCPSHKEYPMLSYLLREMADMLGGGFDSNSYFYDTVAGTNQSEHLYGRVAENPGRQWIVAVDLHN
jgi:hypothetical protein